MLTVAALYRFTPLDDPAAVAGPLRDVCDGAGVKGTLILAPEGINGTIAGPDDGINAVLAHIRALPGCADLAPRVSHTEDMPFGRMKVRVKREIVTMGIPDVDPLGSVGHYVAPEDWNDLILAPDVVTIDTRNSYEIADGTFDGAVDPGTDCFRDFPRWWQENRAALQGKRIAMFCTGGIRCEKSTSFLASQGVDEVYHLKGGILGYLATVPPEQSLWRGSCFVFDDRGGLDHGLVPATKATAKGC